MPIFEKDRPLLDAFRKGARDALRAVYEFYVDDVVRLVRYGFVSGEARVGGEPDPTAQLDGAHDIFEKAFREPARLGYDGLRPYRPYLLRIGKNNIVDKLRRRRPQVSLDQVDLDGEIAEPAEDREAALDFQRLAEATRAWVAEQDEELRRFVKLRFVDGMAQRELAKEMGVTRRRIRTLEDRAQRGLAAHLAEKKLYERPGSGQAA